MRPAEKVTLETLGGVIVPPRFDATVDLEAVRRRLRLAMRGATVDYNTRYYYEAGPRQYFERQIRLPLEAAPGPLAPIGIVDGPVDAIPAPHGAAISRKRFLGAAMSPSR